MIVPRTGTSGARVTALDIWYEACIVSKTKLILELGGEIAGAMKSWFNLADFCLSTCLFVGECGIYWWTFHLFREEFDKSANEDTRGNEYEIRCS